MRVSRLYVPSPLAQGEQVELADESAHYVRTVLRLKQGDAIILFNGNGGEFDCVLREVSRKTVLLHIGRHTARSVESLLKITLGLGISRGDRMDWVVQKAVELGVDHITPIITERCVVQLKGEKKQLRLQHWQKNRSTCSRTERQDTVARFAGSGEFTRLGKRAARLEIVS